MHENALALELRQMNLEVKQQVPIKLSDLCVLTLRPLREIFCVNL